MIGPEVDGPGKATRSIQFRAERAGGGDGRTYTFEATGSLDGGVTNCDPVQYIATVPHDMGNHNGSSPSKRKSVRLKLRRLKSRRK